MKRHLIYLFLLISHSLFSQALKYSGSIGDWGHDWFIDMDICKDGKTVFSTDCDARYWPTFYGLYKVDNSGQIEWSFDLFRKSYDYHEYSINQTTLDENDNIYSLIYVYQKVNPEVINGLTVYPGLNLFKISPDGVVLWIQKIKQDSISGNNVLYKNGKIYVLGQYSGEISFNETCKFTSKSYYQCFMWMNFVGEDYYIAKYDTTGSFIKAVSFGNNYPDYSIDATLDKNENIYFIGYTDGIGCVNTYSSLFKFDSELNKIWEKTLSTETQTSGLFYATNIFVSKKNKLYVWGNVLYHNPVITNDYTLTHPFENNCYDYSPYLLEFDPDNNKFLRKLELKTSTPQFTEVSYENNNKYRFSNGYMDDYGDDLLIHTVFSDTLAIGDSKIVSKFYPNSWYYQDYILFSVNFNTFTPKLLAHYSGDFPVGNQYNDFSGKIKYNENDKNLYISGSFTDKPLKLFGCEINNNSGNGCYDVFYAKVDLNKYINGISNISTDDNIILYPNPCDVFLKIISFEQVDEVYIYNTLGKLLGCKKNYNNTINISDLKSGLYTFLLYKNQKKISQKIVLKK